MVTKTSELLIFSWLFFRRARKVRDKEAEKRKREKDTRYILTTSCFSGTSLYIPRLNPRLNLVWQPPLLFRPRLEDSGWCGSGHSRHQSIIIPAQIGGRLHTASRRKGPFVNLRASLMNRQCCSRSALFRLKMEIADISHLNCFQARFLLAACVCLFIHSGLEDFLRPLSCQPLIDKFSSSPGE